MQKNESLMEKKLEASLEVSPTTKELSKKDSKALITYTFFWTIMLFIAVPFAMLYTGEGLEIFDNLFLIWTSPSKLITDYFELGSLASSFFNAAICGLACNLLIVITKAKPNATLLAGYFLVIAHCFYGLNFINMWPSILGIFVYSLIFKVQFNEILHLAFFSTSLGPFVSDFLFRYTLGESFVFGEPHLTVLGVVLAILFGLFAGFIIPALMPGTTKMHRGYNLFKAGLAIGLFGIFAHSLFYKTLGIDTPDTVITANKLDGQEYVNFVNIFFFVIFLSSILIGFFKNNKSFKGYKKLWNCDGWKDDFPDMFGIDLTIINIGLYGLFILLYFNIAFLITDGVGYTGPTAGVTIAAITFAASGQTIKNVWPIIIGYTAVSLVTFLMCNIFGLTPNWSLTTQGYINGIAFATGLCPFTGKYGRKYGFIAGAIHAILCTSTASMHGGFVLYNGGLTSGLTALLLLPILDFYNVKPKETHL